VLPNSLARSKVGRAVRCAPPGVAQNCPFRPFWGARGAHGVPALPAKPVGQHVRSEAQTWSYWFKSEPSDTSRYSFSPDAADAATAVYGVRREAKRHAAFGTQPMLGKCSPLLAVRPQNHFINRDLRLGRGALWHHHLCGASGRRWGLPRTRARLRGRYIQHVGAGRNGIHVP
jgi:hypothetical protein